MKDLVKTTVTVPEDLLRIAKLTALQEKTNLSSIIREGLQIRLSQRDFPKKSIKKKDPLRYLGVFKLGIKIPYKHRSDLYEEHTRRKMGLR